MELEKLKKDLEEVKALLAQATRQRIKDVLSIEQRKIETDILNLEVKETVKINPTPSAVANRKYQIELQEYAWDQSDNFVKIFITLPGVHNLSEDSIQVDFTKTSLLVRIENLNNKDYKLTMKELHSPINVEKSYKKIKTDMVAIYMKKLQENQRWSHLTLTEKRVSEIRDSSYKDPNAGDDDFKDDPQAGIMNIMKRMYEKGDPQTKQMIAKAFSESQQKSKNMTLDDV